MPQPVAETTMVAAEGWTSKYRLVSRVRRFSDINQSSGALSGPATFFVSEERVPTKC